MTADLAIALNRFGLGATSGDSGLIRDGRAWLLNQLNQKPPIPFEVKALPSSAQLTVEVFSFVVGQGASPTEPTQEQLQRLRLHYGNQVAARVTAAITTTTPVYERLTHFWANHFAVSGEKLFTLSTGGTLEAEAIRPHVMGRFADMLLAVEQHPAMLMFLDQFQSVGPNSMLGKRMMSSNMGNAPRRIGLNENLAREILELHTLGVRTGYTQADVTELARAITGWSLGGVGRAQRFTNGEPGTFAFIDPIHEPGRRTIMGKTYSQNGQEQGRAILLDLARHPATALHVCTKLARHFVADDPPQPLVQRLVEVFIRSDGNLPDVYQALAQSPEAWLQPLSKFKTPWEHVISALRACEVKTVEGLSIAGLFGQLGQLSWMPGSPAGWPDKTDAWAGPDALVKRVEWVSRLSGRFPNIDARALAEAVLPGVMSTETKSAIARAESGEQALALLLASPEFLRR